MIVILFLLVLSVNIVLCEERQVVNAVELVEKQGQAVVMVGTNIAIGSGFNVDPSGLVVTNYHIVRNAKTILVRFSTGDIYDVIRIFNIDKIKDICILKIHGFDLPTAHLGNSNNVKIGEEVIAIGNPQGFENTVSTGIISGKRESIGFSLFQTTAPISPGSSGGPLFNKYGEIIGITSLSWAETGSQNINFAIPINYTRGLLQYDMDYSLDILKDDENDTILSDNPSQAFDFRKTIWGMSISQVKASENIEPYFTDSSTLAYRTKLLDHNFLLIYQFQNSKLYQAAYVFADNPHDRNRYIDIFTELRELLEEKYHEAHKKDIIWLNNRYKGDGTRLGLAVSLGHLYFDYYWFLERNDINLFLTGKNSKMTLAIVYTSITHRNGNKGNDKLADIDKL